MENRTSDSEERRDKLDDFRPGGSLRNVLTAGPKEAQFDANAKSIFTDPDVSAYIMRGSFRELWPYSVESVRDYFMAGADPVQNVPVHADERLAWEMLRRVRSLDCEISDPIEGLTYFDHVGRLRVPVRFTKVPNVRAMLSWARSGGRLESPYGGGIGLAELRRNPVDCALWLAISEMQVSFRGQKYRGGRDTYYRGRAVSAERGVEFVGSAYGKLQGVACIWIYPRPADRIAAGLGMWPPAQDHKTQDVGQVRSVLRSMERPERSVDIYLGKTDQMVSGPQAVIELLMLLLLIFTDTGKPQAEVCDILADDFKIQNAAELAERSINMGGLAQQYIEVGYESASADMAKLHKEIERISAEKMQLNTENMQLNEENAQLNEEKAHLSVMVGEMQNEIAGLKERISQLEDKA